MAPMFEGWGYMAYVLYDTVISKTDAKIRNDKTAGNVFKTQSECLDICPYPTIESWQLDSRR